jgi:N-acetylglucosamine-6-phosphate deacetylase
LVKASARRAQEMVDACKGTLLLATLAPEVEGATDAARVFLDNGVTCSAGHTSARYREGLLAIGLGYRSLTHAFNGMPPLDHRDPSILVAFIQDARTLVQVICDGHHVSPVMVDVLHRLLGDRIVLATDNMPPAGPGYHIDGGVMRSEDGTIAGSALRIDQALLNYMEYTELPFERAIVGATSAAAKLIGHENELGRIAPGLRADLSFWNEDFQVVATMVGGSMVYDTINAPAHAAATG